jgi:hypothetical protein
MKAIKILTYCLVAFAGLFFLYVVILAIIYSLKETPDKMPEIANWAITAIGGVLAINLGAVLGLKIAEGTSFKSFKIKALKEPVPSAIQIGAAFLYVLILFVALIVWAILGFESKPENIVPAIPSLSKTLCGVIVGTLAAALNVTRKQNKTNAP